MESGAPALLELRRYHFMVAGSTTPIVVRAVPLQSPTTGSQPGAPYWNAPASGVPGLAWLCRYQMPVDGSNTPIPAGLGAAAPLVFSSRLRVLLGEMGAPNKDGVAQTARSGRPSPLK